MLNYKCKSHKGRSADNKTDTLTIVEIGNGIEMCFAKIIPDKKAITIIIICKNVCQGATTHTDEHKSYSGLCNIGFIHGKVCHKHCFVNTINDVNTQAVESFHNVIKSWIKQRKGVLTIQRAVFLNEFCFYYNNRKNYLKRFRK
ncbi:hypothetical protein BDAP_000799 [Binucleata daphniae]